MTPGPVPQAGSCRETWGHFWEIRRGQGCLCILDLLPLSGWVTWGKLITLSEPSFSLSPKNNYSNLKG